MKINEIFHGQVIRCRNEPQICEDFGAAEAPEIVVELRQSGAVWASGRRFSRLDRIGTSADSARFAARFAGLPTGSDHADSRLGQGFPLQGKPWNPGNPGFGP